MSDNEESEPEEQLSRKEIEHRQLVKWMQGRKYRKKLKLKGLKSSMKLVVQNCKRMSHVNGKNIFLYRNDGSVIKPGKGRRYVLKTSNQADFDESKEAILNSITESMRLLLAARDLYTADGELVTWSERDKATDTPNRNYIGNLVHRSDIVVSSGERFLWTNMHRISPSERKMVTDGDIPVRCLQCGKFFKTTGKEKCAVHTGTIQSGGKGKLDYWSCCKSDNPEKMWCSEAAGKSSCSREHNWKPPPLPMVKTKTSKRNMNRIVPIKGVIRYDPDELAQASMGSGVGSVSSRSMERPSSAGPRLPATGARSHVVENQAYRDAVGGVAPNERSFTPAHAQARGGYQGGAGSGGKMKRPQSAPAHRIGSGGGGPLLSPSRTVVSELSAVGSQAFVHNLSENSYAFDDSDKLRVQVNRVRSGDPGSGAYNWNEHTVSIGCDGFEYGRVVLNKEGYMESLQYNTADNRHADFELMVNRTSVLRVEIRGRSNGVRPPDLLGFRDVFLGGVLMGLEPVSQWVGVSLVDDENALLGNVHLVFEIADAKGKFSRQQRPTTPTTPNKPNNTTAAAAPAGADSDGHAGAARQSSGGGAPAKHTVAWGENETRHLASDESQPTHDAA